MTDSLRQTLAVSWAEVLGHGSAAEVHDTDNFMAVGGGSLQVLMLQTLINERLQATVDLLELFELLAGGTFADLVADLAAEGRHD